MNKFIDFKRIPFKGKTKKFKIISKLDKDVLGQISWYPGWRRYVFTPTDSTIWDTMCLNEIMSFINVLMKDRQAKMGKYKGYISKNV